MAPRIILKPPGVRFLNRCYLCDTKLCQTLALHSLDLSVCIIQHTVIYWNLFRTTLEDRSRLRQRRQGAYPMDYSLILIGRNTNSSYTTRIAYYRHNYTDLDQTSNIHRRQINTKSVTAFRQYKLHYITFDQPILKASIDFGMHYLWLPMTNSLFPKHSQHSTAWYGASEFNSCLQCGAARRRHRHPIAEIRFCRYCGYSGSEGAT